MAVFDWFSAQTIPQRKWTCGYCGVAVASIAGYYKSSMNPTYPAQSLPMQANQITAAVPQILICPQCDKPTFFEGDKQMPGVVFGDEVKNVPDPVAAAYREARNCMTVSAHTASALMSRKLLMNIAVDHGAKEGLKFVEYIDYLDQNGFIPPNGKAWVEHVKNKGNEATHKVPTINKDDAEDLVFFTSMLLRFIYEIPNRLPKKT